MYARQAEFDACARERDEEYEAKRQQRRSYHDTQRALGRIRGQQHAREQRLGLSSGALDAFYAVALAAAEADPVPWLAEKTPYVHIQVP